MKRMQPFIKVANADTPPRGAGLTPELIELIDRLAIEAAREQDMDTFNLLTE